MSEHPPTDKHPHERHGPQDRQTPPMSEEEAAAMFEAPSWEERYSATDRVWSGNPNPQLVAEASALAPGTALDVGCGEGADACWLAGRGWQVVGADFSTVALAKAAQHAADLGVAARIDWVVSDVRHELPSGRFDLVSAQFMHLPSEQRPAFFDRLAAAVAIGGTLLIVAHHPHDLDSSLRWHLPDRFYAAEEIVGRLDPELWIVERAEARARIQLDSEGAERPVTDTVLRARRRD